MKLADLGNEANKEVVEYIEQALPKSASEKTKLKVELRGRFLDLEELRELIADVDLKQNEKIDVVVRWRNY